MKEVPVSCNRDCGAGCPLVARVEKGRLTRVRDNPARPPGMAGCARGYRMPWVVYHPQRLSRPLMRVGPRGSGDFREVSWDEALDWTSSRLEEIRERYGAPAVLRLGGSGSCRGALHNSSLLSRRFLALFGGYTGGVDSYSSAAEDFVIPFLFGFPDVGIDPDTLAQSRLVVLWGANIVDTRFGCLLEDRLRALRRRGTPIVVVDPRRSRTVERLADRWIPLRPGTDAALMAAVLYELFEKDLIHREFAERVSEGFGALERSIRGTENRPPKSPEWAENICGTPAGTIRELANIYGSSRPAALISGLSVQRTVGGEEAVRMAVALQVATGNLGVPGGAPGTNIWGRLPSPRCGRLPVPATARFVGIPVYRWADAVLEGRSGGHQTDIRAVYNVGGNYLCTGSDVSKNIRAFARLELAVCHELFLTPTARHCDVVLPATTFLEREDIVFSAHNYLLYSQQAIDPVGQVRDDYDILAELAGRLGFGPEFTQGRTAGAWIDRFLEESEISDPEEFRRSGIFTGLDQRRIGLAGFVADPEANPLPTPSGRIELASDRYTATGYSQLPEYRGPTALPGYPLQLITPHARNRINSQYGSDPVYGGQEAQRLWLHPDDASARKINDGELVEISSSQGRIRVRVRVTEGILPGVTCLLAGAWPSFDRDGADVGGCVNVLTSTDPTWPSQGSRTHTTFVEVRALA